MSTPFLSEIKIISFNFPPKGWAFCNGQIMAIQQNAALFSLLGTTYGGNGQTTFALPNLQGQMPDPFRLGFLVGPDGRRTKSHAHPFGNSLAYSLRQREPMRRPLPVAPRIICGARNPANAYINQTPNATMAGGRLAIMAEASRTTTCPRTWC